MEIWVSELEGAATYACADHRLCVVAALRGYPRQQILVVACASYSHLVPRVEEENHFFLKTIIPSRKATRDYLNRGDADDEH